MNLFLMQKHLHKFKTMEYIYINRLKDLKEKRGWNYTGVNISEINELQEKFNIIFPVAYNEFLSYSGNFSTVIKQGHSFEFLEQDQQDAQKWLKEYDLENLIKKPFWVIATDGDSESFWYFHLDEGDNPAIYRLSCMYYGEVKDKLAFGKVADSFQAWIEKAIDYFEEDPENQ